MAVSVPKGNIEIESGVNSNLVVDVDDKGEIVQWTRDKRRSTQQWKLAAVPESEGFYHIKSASSDDVIAAANMWTLIIEPLQRGKTAQQWSLISVGGDVYRLNNLGHNRIASVNEASTDPGAAVILYDDQGQLNQQWKLIPTVTTPTLRGPLQAWGNNATGQLGDGTTLNRSAPLVLCLTGLKAIAGGGEHSLALLEDGTVRAWGKGGDGQIGDNATFQRAAPRRSRLTGVTAIAAGAAHSLALLLDNDSVVAWGDNAYGQLGDNSTTDRLEPRPVTLLDEVTAIAAGDNHSLALKDGAVYAWGYNGYGQLGDGSSANRPSPVQVLGLTGVTAIASGYYHGLALLEDGTVRAWGSNVYGQLGDNSTTSRPSPVQVLNLTGVAAIAAGNSGHHSLALLEDGTVFAWGYNGYGQLGEGTATNQPYRQEVACLTGIKAIAAGGNHSLASG